jgi:2-amino-4-hydroxy-6-hydroxymethyldihydropteridine diphosphokinase
MAIVYLALGSNLGDRPANLRAALEALPPEVRLMDESPVYETPPWGYADQPAFLNMAVKAETGLAPRELLAYLKGIEIRLGRTPTFRNGPRQIDIDILFLDDLVLDEDGLIIPHPRLHERAFVLVPLADVAAQVVHPVLKKSVLELLAKVDPGGIRRYSAR